MTEMIERVARALYCLDNPTANEAAIVEEYPTAFDGHYPRSARAAIEAMLEPTEKMIIAGLGADCSLKMPELENGWRVMIKAALEG